VQEFIAKLPAERERFLFLVRQHRPEMLRYVVFDVFQMFLMRVFFKPWHLPGQHAQFPRFSIPYPCRAHAVDNCPITVMYENSYPVLCMFMAGPLRAWQFH
jgi:hypothetical protein